MKGFTSHKDRGVSRRAILTGASAVAVGFAAGRLTGPAFAQQPKRTVTIASHVLARIIDPRVHRTVIEQNVYMHMFDGLVDFDSQMNIRPRLATAWKQLDPRTWRFELRKGVTFHNGEPFNAEAVKFSIEQYVRLDPPYLYISNWTPAWPPTVEVESDHAVLIKTPEPLPNMTRVLPRIGMLPPKATLDPKFANAPIGTGPFKFAEWQKGKKLTLAANPDYWDGAPQVSQLNFITIEDSAARMAALQAGEVDLIWNVPIDRLDEVSRDYRLIQAKNSLVNNMIAFNARAKASPIADRRVRQALTYAFDGQSVIEALLNGSAVQGRGPTPSLALGAYNGDGYPARNVEKAKALLKDAGFAKGFTLSLIAQPASFTNLSSIVEVLQAQLAEVGVTVNYEELDQGQMNERAETEKWDLRTDGSTGATGEAQYFYNTAKRNFGTQSAETERLLLQAGQLGDTPERIKLIEAAMKAWWEEVPFLWSFESALTHASRKSVAGVELIPNNWILMRKAQVQA
jgi:peptide/nickel transport system substrate-binding protein